MAVGSSKTKIKTSDFDDVPARDASLFLIDGSSLAYRSFFALPTEIATADGRPTNALLGFANMLIKLISDFNPKTVIVAWDIGGATKRKEQYAEYKSHRPEMPDLLSQQWPHFQPLVEAFGFTNVSMSGYEADDVIGTLSKQASDSGIRTCIVTYDRDAMQLVDENTVVLMTTKGVSQTAAFTPERVKLRYEVRPDQIADFIALRGDTSDNIPGVPGIGDKTAADLLRQFDHLEDLLSNISKVSGAKRKENLTAHSDQARLSYQLAKIVRDLPLDIDLDELTAKEPDRSRMLEIFRTFEFRTLSRRVEELDLTSGSKGDENSDSDTKQSKSSSRGELISARIVSPQEFGRIVESNSQGVEEEIPLVVSILDDDSVAVAALLEEGVPDGQATNKWVAVMQGAAEAVLAPLVGKRILSFDHKSLPIKIRLNDCSDDVLLTTYLLQPGRRTFLLNELLDEEGLSVRLALSSGDDHLQNVATQAALLPLLRDRHIQQLKQLGMYELYRDIEFPTMRVLIDMEAEGIAIDTYRMGEIAAKSADQLDELVDRAHELAGHAFTLGSPKQLATVLFDELNLPAQRSGKTGFSTDARVLRDLRDMHPIIGVIEKWRELSKLKNTYLDSLPTLIDAESGRIHTTFSQTSAATGRLSSVRPNLQNIPIRTSVGREIRSAFIPAEGYKYVSADYSQVELRLLAHISKEPKLIAAFERGDDVHTITAAEVADIAPGEVSREQRSAAKAINFGIIYGISSYGLAQQLQISREQAQEFIERYLGRYPYVSDFINRTIEDAKNNGYVSTLFGRRRPVPELKSRDRNKRQFGERIAVNTILQGTAADIMKLAMIRVHKELRASDIDAKIVLQIHDELLLEVAEKDTRSALKLVKQEMVGAFDMAPALEVEGGVGSNWLEVK